MLEPISLEQTFISNLEKFLKDADKLVRDYYSGNLQDSDLKTLIVKVGHLAADAALAEVETEYERKCECKDLESDTFDSSWY